MQRINISVLIIFLIGEVVTGLSQIPHTPEYNSTTLAMADWNNIFQVFEDKKNRNVDCK